MIPCALQISLRTLITPHLSPSVGGVSSRYSDTLAVVALTDIRASTRYLNTCYGALVQSASVQTHAEVYFQLIPLTKHSYSPDGKPLVGGLEPGAIKPQLGAFGKVWLHPDDVPIAYSRESSGPRQGQGASKQGSRRYSSRGSHDSTAPGHGRHQAGSVIRCGWNGWGLFMVATSICRLYAQQEGLWG